jgi:hypothetical protein
MKAHTRRAALTVVSVAAIGLSAGLWHGQAAVPDNTAPKDTALAKNKNDSDRLPALRAKLLERVDLPQGLAANTPLKDALDFIEETYGVPITLDEEAFKDIEVQKAGEQPVSLPPLKGVRLNTLLRTLLKQVKGNRYTGAFLLRPDGIEVTTSYVVLSHVLAATEFGGEEPVEGSVRILASLDQVVCIDVQKQPLRAALRKLAEASACNIVLDPRVGGQADAAVSATLDNVLTDTAARILAEQADLKVAVLNNVYVVTTAERAASLTAEQKKRRYQPVLPVQGGPPSQ